MTINVLEFYRTCSRFTDEHGVGCDVRLVYAIAKTAASLYGQERDMEKAMELALDHHGVSYKPERGLYKQVMGAYFGKHGALQKQRSSKMKNADQNGTRKPWFPTANSQLPLKFK